MHCPFSAPEAGIIRDNYGYDRFVPTPEAAVV